MFTGIIEAVENIKEVSKGRIEVHIPAGWTLEPGESVAVNGACLTAALIRANSAVFDVSPETFARTNFGALRKGGAVNLERAMKADGRFSGHFVTGHIDGVVRFLASGRAGESHVLEFSLPDPPQGRLVEKGSAALNGISLTVYGITPAGFKAAVIPHTWARTNLKDLRPGDELNIEFDILGKYAAKAGGGRITREWLAGNGF